MGASSWAVYPRGLQLSFLPSPPAGKLADQPQAFSDSPPSHAAAAAMREEKASEAEMPLKNKIK